MPPPNQLTRSEIAPDWLTPRIARHLLDLVTKSLRHAGITGGAAVGYLKETQIRKRKNMIANSLVEAVGHARTSATCVVLACAGDNPRTDLCFMSMTMPPADAVTYRAYIGRQPTGVWTLASLLTSQKTPPGTQQIPSIDDTTLDLFLDAVQDAGGTISSATRDKILDRDFPDLREALLHACTTQRLLASDGSLVTLTQVARDRLRALRPPAPVESPTVAKSATDEFQRLRQAVLDAKANLAPLADEHDRRESERLKLNAEHGKAETAFQNATHTVHQREQALKHAQHEQTLARASLLRIEQQLQQLGDDTAYIHAQRALADAQKAYQEFTAI